jgi:tetratricopeptide (TPR) repeat protein
VNPAKLQGAARDSICEQCHLLGVAQILNPGKQASDFRPGTPLEDTYTVYRNSMPPGTAAQFKVISHVEQLALSMCSRKSNGRLWCGTCHDPHRDPVQPVAFYRSKCLTCHTTAFAKPHPSADSDCIGCHMPKRDAKDGGHTAFTDHRIQRHAEPEQPLMEDIDIEAWREPSDLNLRKRNLGIAYIKVGMERRSATFVVRGYRMLTEVQGLFAEDSDLYSWMGAALLALKQDFEAKRAYARALELDPSSAIKEADLGQAYASNGESDAAIRYLEDSLTKDPLNLSVASFLMDIYSKQGDTARAADLTARMRAAMK